MYSSFYKPSMQAAGSFLNEDRSTKHPNLETKHPKFKTCVHFKNARQSLVKSLMPIQQESSTIANGTHFKSI